MDHGNIEPKEHKDSFMYGVMDQNSWGSMLSEKTYLKRLMSKTMNTIRNLRQRNTDHMDERICNQANGD